MELLKMVVQKKLVGKNGFNKTYKALTIYGKHPSFRFTKLANEFLNLETFKRIDIYQDKTNKKIWYVNPNKKGEFLLNGFHKNPGFMSRYLQQRFNDAFDVKNEDMRFLIGAPIKNEYGTIYPLEFTQIDTLLKHNKPEVKK